MRFLPGLCLVNQALSVEVTFFVIRTSRIEIGMQNHAEACTADSFASVRSVYPQHVCERHELTLFKNLAKSPKLHITNNIGNLRFSLDRDQLYRDVDEVVGDAQRSNAILQRLLPRLTALRELTLMYVTPQAFTEDNFYSSPDHTP
jgi:hypothetical protein